MNLSQIFENWSDSEMFSGVFSVSNERGIIFERCCGFRNRGEGLSNNRETAFGIASGTKLFTSLAVLRLIDDKKLSLHDRLCDLLPYNVGNLDRRVTIFHLLTHTSGVGDYIDEECDNATEQLRLLYNTYPVYLWKRLEYYLPMITSLPPKFEPGARYGYSNAGYILLGLAVEAVSGFSYQQFVADTIINPLALKHTGFYSSDSLPANTAFGYMRDEKTDCWRTNIFSLPILGGSDGGLFTCSDDLIKLWSAIFSNNILSEEMTRSFLSPQVPTNAADRETSCGLGVYMRTGGGAPMFFAVGGDFGVDFFTAYFPRQRVVASALGNTEIDAFPLLDAVRSQLAAD